MKNNSRPPSKTNLKIPAPAHPQERHEPLPSQRPKPADEDPDAMLRIKAIMANQSYKQADHDVDFLNRDDTRGVRLQLDYLKPEFFLKQYGITNTVVVFGSTRISEPSAAQRKVDMLHQSLTRNPADKLLQSRLAIAERILDKSRYYEIAREFSRLVTSHKHNSGSSRIVVVTGGGPGIMEAANRGAYDLWAKSIGLNINLPHEQYPNPYITQELCFSFHYFALRKLHFLLRAKALIAFPGGYGTFDELFETLTLVQTRTIRPLPVILVGETYWRQAFNVDFLVDEGVIDTEDRELFWYAETAQEIWDGILRWYEESREPMFPAD